MPSLERVLLLGPPIPSEILYREPKRFLIPTILLILAAALLLVSLFLPYWKLTLLAPQYPKGLRAQVYVNHLEGDVQEIDGLNHYIGMRPLGEAAPLERSLSVVMIVVLILLVITAVAVRSPWAAILSLPAIAYPILFLADLYFWLRYYGLHLDPHAPLSGSVKPFVPPLLGVGKVGQFSTVTELQLGFYLAVAASVAIVVGLYFHRRVYKPLFEEWLAQLAQTNQQPLQTNRNTGASEGSLT